MPSERPVSPSLALEPYCPARIAGNAATAYLVLGQPDNVIKFGEQALTVFDPARMQGPRALTRFDMAMAFTQGDDPQLERAAAIADDALAVEGARGFASVIKRAEEFACVTTAQQNISAIRVTTEKIRELKLTPSRLALEGPDHELH